MDNSFFLRSIKDPISISKLQICTWEFSKNSTLIEFGIEIDSCSSVNLQEVTFDLYIPWLNKDCKVKDFYDKLKSSENSRFIFNDSVSNTIPLDQGQNTLGVIHKFSGKESLCILPVQFKKDIERQKVELRINLEDYNNKKDNNTNAYIRLAIEPDFDSISTKKKGIGKSTIIYDMKLNENRNIPRNLVPHFKESYPCQIATCFCFHIIPNSYNITFLESEHLKSVRTLEFAPFKEYLSDSRLKEDELMVVFSKKKDAESYTFFSIYTKELIGASQFAIAILINIVCGFLFALPAIRDKRMNEASLLETLPFEFYIAFSLALIMSFYFFLSPLTLVTKKIWSHYKK
jgi:hypothetical protein